MKRGAVVGALGTVAVLIGGGVTVVMVRASQATERAVVELLKSAQIELQRDAPDRAAISPLLRQIANHEVAADPRLMLVRGELQFMLGHLQDAWQAVEPLALGADPEPETLLLAARVHAKLHALRGDLSDIDRAMNFAADHYDASGDVGSLFLAWQSARRGHRAERRDEYSKLMQERHPEAILARVAAALDDRSTSLAALRAFELELDQVPVELEGMIAAHLLADENGAVEEAIERIQAVLQAFPSSVDARNLAALAYHRAEDRGRRDGHLDWLLENAPPNDQRRATWAALRQAPVGG